MRFFSLSLATMLALAACGGDGKMLEIDYPATAPKVSVDRFSSAAAMLMVRTDQNGLPGPNAPVDFDRAPFVSRGFGPGGESVVYYNFDVQPALPSPIYVFFRGGASKPLDGQLNVIDVIPGQAGYSDFWRVNKVTVPDDYVANTIASFGEIQAAGYPIEETSMIVNCPVAPEGSTATRRIGGGSSALMTGWFRGMTVRYFTFEEHALSGTAAPLSPIYVIFNVNPDQPNGGPPSGFPTEMGTEQTHNVLATLPDDDAYSPLWSVNVIDRADFDGVRDLATAEAANVIGMNVATVNCPVAEIGAEPSESPVPSNPDDLLAFLQAGKYARFAAEPAPHPSTGPHGTVRTFANAILTESISRGDASHPIGSASVKEIFRGTDRIGWAVLVKVDADSAAGNGYYWYEYADGAVAAEGRGFSVCVDCHSHSTDDFVYTTTF